MIRERELKSARGTQFISFENLTIQAITDPQQLSSDIKFLTPSNSPLRSHGINLKAELGIEIGDVDFNQNNVTPNGIGASF